MFIALPLWYGQCVVFMTIAGGIIKSVLCKRHQTCRCSLVPGLTYLQLMSLLSHPDHGLREVSLLTIGRLCSNPTTVRLLLQQNIVRILLELLSSGQQPRSVMAFVLQKVSFSPLKTIVGPVLARCGVVAVNNNIHSAFCSLQIYLRKSVILFDSYMGIKNKLIVHVSYLVALAECVSLCVQSHPQASRLMLGKQYGSRWFVLLKRTKQTISPLYRY